MGPSRVEKIEHTADVALRIEADDLETLFTLASEGLYDLIGQLRSAPDGPAEDDRIELTASSVEDLLHDWLSELLYGLDVRRRIVEDIRFRRLGDGRLAADVTVRPLDVDRSVIDMEIKAVTYHDLRIERSDGGYRTTVVFDV